MRKNKFKIIAAIIICLILVVSFLEKNSSDINPQSEPIFNDVYTQPPAVDVFADAENIKTEHSPAVSDEADEIKAEDNEEIIVKNDDDYFTSEPTDVCATVTADAADKLYCTISVNCKSVLDNIDKLKDSKKTIIPDDGTILEEKTVEFFENESVFDVLNREIKKREIQFEFVQTPMYNSVYIEGIGNLYEFDCGDKSGWLYRVNGIKPNFGCSQYKLKNGDKIEVYYSCNLFE